MNDSPVKKLDFDVGKENIATHDVVVDETPKPVKLDAPKLEVVKEDPVDAQMTSIAPTIKQDEADEPLLRENPGRFVLFPIRSVVHRILPHCQYS